MALDIARPRPAKAHISFRDIPPQTDSWALRVGVALREAVNVVRWTDDDGMTRVGWTDKEAAAACGVDRAEFGKWLTGQRNPQLKRIMAVPELADPFAIALARLADFEVVTELRKRRAG